jgi:hypothetical protein
MGRREFGAWPLTMRPQRSERVRQIRQLTVTGAAKTIRLGPTSPIPDGVKKLGWVEKRVNIRNPENTRSADASSLATTLL